jgi:hypothetical protein
MDDFHWVAGVPFSTDPHALRGRLSKHGGTLVLHHDVLEFRAMDGGLDRSITLHEIADVAPHADRPPRLRVTLVSGEHLVYFVLPKRLSFGRNVSASKRDEAVEVIRAALPRDADPG